MKICRDSCCSPDFNACFGFPKHLNLFTENTYCSDSVCFVTNHSHSTDNDSRYLSFLFKK
jgi:hypothetical protein